MYCKHCGSQLTNEAKFCNKCGNAVLASGVSSAVVIPLETTEVIKCGSCGYIGPGEPARSAVYTFLAWIALFFAPIVTIIYFIATHKYRCPKCKSTFLGVKNKKGVFTSQNGAGRPIVVLLFVLVGIAVIGILSSIILVSLNTARQKAKDARDASLSVTKQQIVSSNNDSGTWINFNSANGFSILFPHYPESETTNNPITGTDYSMNVVMYTAESSDRREAFFAQVMTPIGVPAGKKLTNFEGPLSGMLSSDASNTLVSTTKSKFGIYDAMEYRIKNEKEEIVIMGKMIIVESVLYNIMYVFEQAQGGTNWSHYINSFNLN